MTSTSARTKEAVACAHCGAPVGAEALAVDELAFCCNGCRTVYSLLADRQLCAYYTVDPAAPRGIRPDQHSAEVASLTYLDDPALAPRLHDYLDEQSALITLSIPSMHCAACLWLLEQLPRLQQGISWTEVNLPRRTLRLQYEPAQVRLSEVAALLGSLGYAPQFDQQSADRDSQRQDTQAQRRLVTQIGVAGFVLGNVMLLSMPDYLDPGAVEHGFEQLFGWLSLVLAVPLLLYAGGDYLRQAWIALRRRAFAIEQPLAAGMLAMFGTSVYEVYTGTGMGYIDSLAGLIFFLLLGKFVQQLTYRGLAFDRDYRAYFPLSVLVRGSDGDTRIPLAQLKRGDRLVVCAGEIVAADAVLDSPLAYLDYAYITGESAPVTRLRGDRVYAGGRQLGGRIELLVDRPADQASLTQLWNHPAFARQKALTNYSETVTQLSKWFTIATLVLAVGSLVYWLPVDGARALRACVSVLIIACPCALAFAAPFVFGHLTRVLGRHGLYLKNPTVLEQLAHIDTLVFDKTGTLTTPGDITWHGAEPGLKADEQAAVFATLAQSSHPLARRISTQQHLEVLPEAEEVNEVVGRGVAAYVSGYRVRVGQFSFVGGVTQISDASESSVHVSLDGVYRGRFAIHQHVRDGAEDTLSRLSEYELHLLSGDAPQPHWTSSFAEAHTRYRASPEQKLAYIEALQADGKRVGMIGDGLNDAGALSRADVGIALSADATHFVPAADALISGEALPKLPQLLRLARRSISLVQVCFGVSLVYNVIGASFAVQGQLSPVLAAVLMPFSSIGTIVLSTALAYLTARATGLYPLPPDQNQVLG